MQFSLLVEKKKKKKEWPLELLKLIFSLYLFNSLIWIIKYLLLYNINALNCKSLFLICILIRPMKFKMKYKLFCSKEANINHWLFLFLFFIIIQLVASDHYKHSTTTKLFVIKWWENKFRFGYKIWNVHFLLFFVFEWNFFMDCKLNLNMSLLYL